jgi:trimethylamine--corrinoid protein Co-methyltransferase
LNGPGHYLASNQTLQLMQSAYLYPAIGDRKSPNEWQEQGATDITERAAKKVADILSTHYPDHVPEAIDAELRERFPVKLPRSAMRAGRDDGP